MKDAKRLQQLQSVCYTKILLAAVLALFSLFINVSYSNAQSTGGRIRGTVTDASGGAVVGAKISIVNQSNGSARDTVTGTNGEYIFLEVPVGTYEVQVSQTGFKQYVRKGIALDLNEVLGLDI